MESKREMEDREMRAMFNIPTKEEEPKIHPVKAWIFGLLFAAGVVALSSGIRALFS